MIWVSLVCSKLYLISSNHDLSILDNDRHACFHMPCNMNNCHLWACNNHIACSFDILHIVSAAWRWQILIDDGTVPRGFQVTTWTPIIPNPECFNSTVKRWLTRVMKVRYCLPSGLRTETPVVILNGHSGQINNLRIALLSEALKWREYLEASHVVGWLLCRALPLHKRPWIPAVKD